MSKLKAVGSLHKYTEERVLIDLQNIPTEHIVEELLTRNLLDTNGLMSYSIYQLLTRIAVIPCADGIAVRRNVMGAVEALAIRRGTGVFKGRFCSVGGRLLRGESYESCLRRQFRSDLECEIEFLTAWDKPVGIGQYYPLKHPLSDPWPKDFGPENSKHTVSQYYPVRLLGEPRPGNTTSYGGAEASAIEWHSLDNLPGPEHFGYNQHPRFIEALTAAEYLI
jgi:hypothetical protein